MFVIANQLLTRHSSFIPLYEVDEYFGWLSFEFLGVLKGIFLSPIVIYGRCYHFGFAFMKLNREML